MLRVPVVCWSTLILLLAAVRVNGKAGNNSCAKYDGVQCANQTCEQCNVKLTLDPLRPYFGGSANLTASLNSSLDFDQLVYLFCYYDPQFPPNFMQRSCIESNSTNASFGFTWNVIGSTNASVYVYNVTKMRSGKYNYSEVGCMVIDDICVGANWTTNVTVTVSEEDRPADKSAFYAGGDIIINASTVLREAEQAVCSLTQIGSGYSVDEDGGNQTIRYMFYYSGPNMSQNKTVVNQSYVLFNTTFDANPAQSFTIKLVANNTDGNEIFVGNSTTTIDVVEKVHNPVLTVNDNKTVHRNDVVLVNINVSGSFPITVEVKLKYVSNPSDGRSYNCTQNFPISDIIDDATPTITNQCQFNRTGDFQFQTTFENNASCYVKNFSVTISDGPPPVVVASSTIAVVVVVVLLVVVILSIIVIFVYVPYRAYKKRVTETANFSFIDLQMPSRWEKFKIKVEVWRNRVFRRDSRLGLINYSDVEEEDLLGNLYGSLNLKNS